ncbi:MAG: hypothetical protein ABIJ09_07900 [Pseudomonadota bacterium]
MHVVTRVGTTLLALSLWGCTPDDGLSFRARFGYLPRSIEGPCPSQPVAKPNYTAEIDTFRVQVTAPGQAALRKDFPTVDLADKARLQLDGVQAGTGRNIQVNGLLGKVGLWRGVHLGVNIEAGQQTEVGVLITRLAAMTCSRSPMTSGRVFASATPLADGRVLLAGGFFEIANVNCPDTSPNCRKYTATPTAEIYDPFKGTFSSVGDLIEARGLHKAALLSDGRVLLVGGAGELRYDPAQSFPLVPSLHRVAMEIFDPVTSSFSAGPDDPDFVPRVFHTVTRLDDGRLLIAGGGAQVSAADASKKTALCQVAGGQVVCTSSSPMRYPRIGHTATLLDDGRVFVWGGVTDAGASGTSCDSAGVTQCPEWWRPDLDARGEPAFVAVDVGNPVGGAGPASNLFFAAATRIGSYGVVIAGGLLRDGSTLPLQFLPPTDSAFLYANYIETIGNSVGGPPFRMGGPRLLHEAVPLGVDGRGFFAGGYRDLGLTPSNRFDIFDAAGDSGQQGGFMPDITVAEESVLLRQARGGLSLVHVGGGAVVAIGGEDKDGNGNHMVVDTAEIYTDKLEPQL